MRPKQLLSVIFFCLSIWVSCLYGYERSELMEPKAVIVFRISNCETFLKGIRESPLGKLWNSTEMKPFLNNQSLEHTLIKSIFLPQMQSPAMEEAVELIRKILSMFKGEVILGFEPETSGRDKETKFFALAEMSATDYKKTRELLKLESKARGEKTISQRHVFQEVELIQNITIDTNVDRIDIGKNEEKKSDWMAFYGDTFINTNSRPWVEQCIVHLKKEFPYSPPGLPTLQIWLPDGFINYVVKEKYGDVPDNTITLFQALGLDRLGKLSFEWRITPISSKIHLHVQNKGGKRGLWTLLNNDPLPRNFFLGHVPGNVLSYQVIRLDIPAFWEEIPAMLDAFGPKAYTQFRMGLTAASQMLQVDIERDIVANLGTLLSSYSRLEGIQDESLYVLQLRNSRAMGKTLGKLFTEGAWLRTMMKENFELLNLQEHNVYSFKIPQFKTPANKSDPKNTPSVKQVYYGITIVDGNLVFGRLNLLRSFIHGSRDNKAGRKFYQSQLFTRMIRRVPDNAVGYGFADITQWIKPAVNYVKTIGQDSENQPHSEENSETKGERKPDKTSKFDPFDNYFKNLEYDRLPSPEFIRSFFGPWMSYYQFNGKEFSIKWEFHNPI